MDGLDQFYQTHHHHQQNGASYKVYVIVWELFVHLMHLNGRGHKILMRVLLCH